MGRVGFCEGVLVMSRKITFLLVALMRMFRLRLESKAQKNMGIMRSGSITGCPGQHLGPVPSF